jgi:hypothetical protein
MIDKYNIAIKHSTPSVLMFDTKSEFSKPVTVLATSSRACITDSEGNAVFLDAYQMRGLFRMQDEIMKTLKDIHEEEPSRGPSIDEVTPEQWNKLKFK